LQTAFLWLRFWGKAALAQALAASGRLVCTLIAAVPNLLSGLKRDRVLGKCYRLCGLREVFKVRRWRVSL
jgi:hypothetical protein